VPASDVYRTFTFVGHKATDGAGNSALKPTRTDERRDALDLRVADRVGDLALIWPQPDAAGQGRGAFGQDDLAFDPLRQVQPRRRGVPGVAAVHDQQPARAFRRA